MEIHPPQVVGHDHDNVRPVFRRVFPPALGMEIGSSPEKKKKQKREVGNDSAWVHGGDCSGGQGFNWSRSFAFSASAEALSLEYFSRFPSRKVSASFSWRSRSSSRRSRCTKF